MNKSKHRVSVVGTGYWGKNLVRNFSSLGALHSVCDANGDTARALAEEHNVSCQTDFRAVLNDPDVDAVALATPTEQHGAMAMEALRCGKDVFVEKPLALGLVGELPVSAYSQGSNYLHSEIADTTVSLITFASGLKAHIFVSWLHPFKEQKLIIVGSKQMAVFDDVAPWEQKLQLYPHNVEWSEQGPVAQKAEVAYVPVEASETLREECAHFLACIGSRKQPLTDAEEGIRVLKVLNACQRALETGEEQRVDPPFTRSMIHPTAIVDEGATVGDGSKIWHFSHVLTGSAIGEGCNIGQNVVVGPNVRIGSGCRIQNNVSVYDGVTLEEDVFCGPSMVFTNVINPRSHTSRKEEFRRTLVKKGASIGANATIVCGNTLGQSSFVAAGAVVTKDVPDHALVVGNPARQVGWMCQCGEKLDAELKCTVCQRAYAETDSGLSEVESTLLS